MKGLHCSGSNAYPGDFNDLLSQIGKIAEQHGSGRPSMPIFPGSCMPTSSALRIYMVTAVAYAMLPMIQLIQPGIPQPRLQTTCWPSLQKPEAILNREAGWRTICIYEGVNVFLKSRIVHGLPTDACGLIDYPCIQACRRKE